MTARTIAMLILFAPAVTWGQNMAAFMEMEEGQQYSTATATDPDLIVWYKCNTDPALESPWAVVDSSGNGLDAFQERAGSRPTYDAGTLYSPGGTYSASSTGAFPIATYPFSVSLWAKAEAWPGTIEHAGSLRNTTNASVYFSAAADLTVTAFYLVARNTTQVRTVGTITTRSTGTWYHVVCTYSSQTSRKMYVDGVLDATSTTDCGNVGTINSATILNIENSAAGWKGWVDDMRVYKRVLSTNEITTLYSEGRK